MGDSASSCAAAARVASLWCSVRPAAVLCLVASKWDVSRTAGRAAVAWAVLGVRWVPVPGERGMWRLVVWPRIQRGVLSVLAVVALWPGSCPVVGVRYHVE